MRLSVVFAIVAFTLAYSGAAQAKEKKRSNLNRLAQDVKPSMESTQDPADVFYATDAEPDFSEEPDYTEEPDYSEEPDYTEEPDYSVEPDYTEEPDYYSDEPGFTPGIATPVPGPGPETPEIAESFYNWATRVEHRLNALEETGVSFAINEQLERIENEMRDQFDEIEEWRESIRARMRSFNATVREKFEEAAESRQQLQDEIEEKLDDMKIGLCPSRYNSIIYDGEADAAGATSVYGAGHEAANAFDPEREPWATKENEIPATVWYNFTTSVSLGKISLQTRSQSSNNNQAPKSFKVLGSNDCSNWSTLLHVTDSGLTTEGQTKEWDIPCKFLEGFGCIGVKVTKTQGSSYAAIANIEMWGHQI